MQGVTMYFMAEFTVTGANPLELKFVNIAFTPSSGNVNT